MLRNGRFPDDLRSMSVSEMKALASEIRDELIRTVSRTGGHLASNLGAVELTIALHRVFESPKDKLVFDVGHQTYVHKLLTGRWPRFGSLRQSGGLNGFPSARESAHDAFTAGHASTAISAALGLARARDLRGEDSAVVAVVGDGALTGGMCYEALNDAGQSGTRLIVVLNDNEMSISPNVGAVSEHLANLRQSSSYLHAKTAIRTVLERIPVVGEPTVRFIERIRDALKAILVGDQFFEAMGFTYTGPIDGHDLKRLIHALGTAKRLRRPVLLHVVTQKGRGYAPAETQPDAYHGLAPHMSEKQASDADGTPCGATAAAHLAGIARNDSRISVVVAAMLAGTGMNAFAKAYPNRLFDVGIAEEHAVVMAGGLAAGGMRPYVSIYSTFLQRAYDQMLTDICLPGLPVTFLLDRGGLVGEDGATHQGVYDLSWLREMPGMTVSAPSSASELRALIDLSLRLPGPLAIRYPKTLPESIGGESEGAIKSVGKGRVLSEGEDIWLAAVGASVAEALEAARILRESGISVGVIDARFIKPLDEVLFLRVAGKARLIATVEENILAGGFGSALEELFARKGVKAKTVCFGIPDQFIPHATIAEQRRSLGLDAESIAGEIDQKWKEVINS